MTQPWNLLKITDIMNVAFFYVRNLYSQIEQNNGFSGFFGLFFFGDRWE